jgi:hypothetical protein
MNDLEMMFSGLCRSYHEDAALMAKLGLKTGPFGRDWTDLGTVIVQEAEPDGQYGPRPESTVKVEVSAMPAQFWKFTIIRPKDDAKTVNGKVIGIYEPLEKFVVRTGSGSFSQYWPTAEMIAHNTMCVEKLP